jgi:hypothetical protein
MIELLSLGLRAAGVGLILLSLIHIPIARELRWKEEAKQMSSVNENIFHVHTFFICLGLGLMGLPCLVAPSIFLMPSLAGEWLSWSLSFFWFVRLYFQWFVYPFALWLGRLRETLIHCLFTLIWIGLAWLFALCGCVQRGWLE